MTAESERKTIQLQTIRGDNIREIQSNITTSLEKQGFDPKFARFRFFNIDRIQKVLSRGNDRSEDGTRITPLELEAKKYGYGVNQTIWAAELPDLYFWTDKGKNLLRGCGISIYDRRKLLTRSEMKAGTRSESKGCPTYHMIEAKDPKDALVAVFERDNFTKSFVSGVFRLLRDQGVTAAAKAIKYDIKRRT